eukprot:GHRQ01036785.1.p2 GENE.GHRQ01036785.1~~GHRQ01036785.1.p2  ORF type:complete len:161 (+),score=11.24 GHRQ01036785.1:174-656(+)
MFVVNACWQRHTWEVTIFLLQALVEADGPFQVLLYPLRTWRFALSQGLCGWSILLRCDLISALQAQQFISTVALNVPVCGERCTQLLNTIALIGCSCIRIILPCLPTLVAVQREQVRVPTTVTRAQKSPHADIINRYSVCIVATFAAAWYVAMLACLSPA